MKTTIEICCVSLKDCIHAQEQGADRIELCASMVAGGLTPSLGMFKLAKANVDIPIMIMIRPRGVGFCYNEMDYNVMKEDIKIFLENGADGIVFGILNKDKTIDQVRTKEIVDLVHSYQREVVFHRAIDECVNMEQAIEQLIECGIDRILTAGGQGNALDHLEELKAWQIKYTPRVQIQTCGSIREDNAVEVLQATGIEQVHSACRTFAQDESDVKAEELGYHNAYDKVCATKCKNLVDVIRNAD